MTVTARVTIELFPADRGGLAKSQQSGTRSLLYRFDLGGESATFGAFLDLDDERPVAPGIGPVGGVLTFWADTADRIMAGDRFDIAYPVRLVGHGRVERILSTAPAGQMPTTDAVRRLIQRVLILGEFPGREQLLDQVDCVEYVEGPVTMMDLRVVGGAPAAIDVPSPAPSTPTVIDETGEAIGELLLWLDAQGYISCLEYAWFTDEMPTVLPRPDCVRER